MDLWDALLWLAVIIALLHAVELVVNVRRNRETLRRIERRLYRLEEQDDDGL